MEYLTVKNQQIELHINTQIGKSNRPFRMCATYINENVKEKWDNNKKSFVFHYIYTFIYIDNNEIFELEFNYNDEFLRKL